MIMSGTDDKTIIKNIDDILIPKEGKETPYLIIISGKSSGTMYRLTLENREFLIGRNPECDIILEDRGISRHHAKIYKNSTDEIIIEDLNSTNGTFVQGRKIKKCVIRDGDKIQLGNTIILKFSYQDPLEERFHRELYESATKDGLTGIYNKKHFLEHFKREFNYCVRYNIELSLLIFDIDHFKKINDTYGHVAGDFVLRKLAKTISSTIRRDDFFARYGGEEFVFVLRGINDEKAFFFAERIRRLIESTDFTFENKKIAVTISIGIATLSDSNYKTPQDMIKDADRYLYKAKNRGRNRVESHLLK